MSTTFDLNSIVSEIATAHERSLQIAPFTSRFGDFDIDTAYAVADTIHRRRIGQGNVPVGRKIGLTNSAVWPQLGASAPMWSYMYDTTVIRLTEDEQTFALRGFVEPRIEPEIVVHFHAAPPVGGGIQEVIACIDWVAPAFEIVQSHFPEWKFHVADAVADSAFHCALLLGQTLPVSRLGPDVATALERFSVDLSCDGILAESGAGISVLGGPLHAIDRLIGVLSAQPDLAPIQAGEMISTGSLTKAFPLTAGQTWAAGFSGLLLAAIRLRTVA